MVSSRRVAQRPVLAVLSTLLAGLLLPSVATASAPPSGSLDPPFGIGGTVVTDLAGADDWARALGIQDNGRIVAVGTTFGGFALARYNRNGTLDPSFGNAGEVLTEFAGTSANVMALAIQRDGRIVAAGPSVATGWPSDFALARYNP